MATAVGSLIYGHTVVEENQVDVWECYECPYPRRYYDEPDNGRCLDCCSPLVRHRVLVLGLDRPFLSVVAG